MCIFALNLLTFLKEQYPVTAHALNFDFLDRMSRNQKMRGK